MTPRRLDPIIRIMPETNVAELFTVAQAMAVLDVVPVTPRVVRIGLADAQGMRLAEDIAADRDAPPFDKSQMDGYAIRCADTARVPVELRVIGEIAAGTMAASPLQAGEAMAIMTGAPVPAGADGVVPVEETELLAGVVRIRKPAVVGRYIAMKGSDAREGQIVLKRGMLMEAAQLAAAASVGQAEVNVYARPHAAVLSTGDELVPFDQVPGPSAIRNSNNIMLIALLRKLGCEAVDLGTAPDRPEAIRDAMRQADADVLFVTGGMSMGTHDYVPAVMRELDYEFKITKLRIKPGKPFVFGMRSPPSESSSPPPFVFGLPGNPVSGFVCAARLASRLIARLGGGQPREKWLSGTLDAGVLANGPREFYQPAIWTPPPSGGTSGRSQFPIITPLLWKGSADLYTLAAANALLVRGENEPPLGKGVLVRVLEI